MDDRGQGRCRRCGGATVANLPDQLPAGLKNISKQGPLELTDGKMVIEAQSADPGWLLLEVTGKNAQGKDIKAAGGAVFSPESIQPSAAPPR